MSEFAEAIEKLRHCERRMIAAETHATLGCGHHVSNLDRTVESGTALCRLCDLESRCRDAEKQERELAAENARLREWVRELRKLLCAAHPFVSCSIHSPRRLAMPADPAVLSIAVATVRRCASRLPGHPANALEYEAYTAACELLAREFVRLLDAGELARVRPLEWVNHYGYWSADGAFGPYTVDDAGWCFDGGYTEYHGQPIEQSKAECDAHNRARLAAALEPLIVKERK